MSDTHRFKDEWALRAYKTIPSVTPNIIDAMRAVGKPHLAEALVRDEVVTEKQLIDAVCATLHVEAAPNDPGQLDKAAVSLVPEKICRRFRVVPFGVKGEQIKVAMENPLDVDALGDIQVVSGRTPIPYFTLGDKLTMMLGHAFESEPVVYDLLENIDEKTSVEVLENSIPLDQDLTPDSIQAPVVQLTNSIIAKAVRMHASDIHIEHDATSSLVRFRIDGMLNNILNLPLKLAQGPLIARIKIMANLDISVHHRPQDGRAKVRVGKNEIGLRISTLPTNFGEKAVIRVLDKHAAEVPLEQLGFNDKTASKLKTLLKQEQGMLLVTGPTGCGKTTTLYSILNRLKTPDVNIVTIEDPIEYKLEWINQTQVNEKQGLTFPSVLRSVLRQDPDIIMIGEIRDRETADVAFQAAMTGHLVLTTLHTNDTVSTVSRLVDIGVERFKIAPGLLAITAQRLVRRLCSCKKPLEKIPAVVEKLLTQRNLSRKVYQPVGCDDCGKQGYKGRLSLIELFEVDEEMKELIRQGTEEKILKENAIKRGILHTMLDDALTHLADGSTSIEELESYLQIPTVQSPSAPKEPAKEESTPRRILVADDDPRMRVLLRRLLEVQGYTVDECDDGSRAIEQIAASRPDLLIIDYVMPQLNGRDAIKTLKHDMGYEDLPIIMLTSNTDDENQEEIIRLGADDYIMKPIKPPLVLARVNALFRRLGYKV